MKSKKNMKINIMKQKREDKYFNKKVIVWINYYKKDSNSWNRLIKKIILFSLN